MGMLYYVSYLGALTAFAFITLSLASGLLYVSELIEEHSKIAKQIGKRGIYVIIFLHAMFYFTDSLPLLQTLFSITCHIVYLQNFSQSWPLISLSSPTFIGSCALVIADHFLWFFYFSRITHEARYSRSYIRGGGVKAPGFTEIASFFGICVWLAPLFLFLSLSANDNALPMSTPEPGSPSLGSSDASISTNNKNRVSLIRSIFSLLSFDKLPKVKSRGTSDEGILAPRSPILIPQQQHTRPIPTSPSLRPLVPLHPLPPRSPRIPSSPNFGQELEVQMSSSTTSIRLKPPPARRPSIQNLTGSSSDNGNGNGNVLGLGLGMRRVSSKTQNGGGEDMFR